ncbi:sugar phosphate isomerase/epimerase [Schumannella luteola]|nr:sugar phosphate isomerase/epimerase [Schumannella luteola]
MLQFAGTTAGGSPVTGQPAEVWRALLQPAVDAGYTAIELASNWVRAGDLDSARRAELKDVLADAGLAPVSVAVPRESILNRDADKAAAALAFSHRSIDAAAELGAPIVCFGLHDVLTPEQKAVQWFWTVPGDPGPADAETRAKAIREYRELADHAESLGLEISIEMYEEGFLSSGAASVDFLDEIGSSAAGLNPDLGNLVRHQGPIEPWEHTAAQVLPRTNYWHVKNYSRLENPAAGVVLTHPSTLATGIIDYRRGVHYAIAHGFSGAFVVEHYGGDGLSVGAENERYLRSILPR